MEEIEELIRRHDDYQFEVKLGYDLTRDSRKDRYRVEFFFFLPQNLDVNEATYTKKQFYRDLLLYIRFKAPEIGLESLTDPNDDRSPLRRIGAKLDALKKSRAPGNISAAEYEIKLLGCILKSALWDRIRDIRKSLRAKAPPPSGETISPLLRSYVSQARKVAEAFRGFRERLSSPSAPESLLSAYSFTDEYMSLLIEGRTHQLLQEMGRRDLPFLEACRGELTDLIREETEYRRSRGYPSIVDETRDNETFIFRLGVLKKYVSNALHLSVRTEKEGRGIEQLGLALGAGVAMFFATGVAFYYQKVYGTLSLSFLSVLVVSYMFKDRIKALFQSYFQRVRSERVMDLATDIFEPFNGEKVGVCHELARFVPEERLDPDVLALRNRDHITEIENAWRSERVLHYVKEIVLFSKSLRAAHSRKTALIDIARFNLRNFLLKMDEPDADIFVLRGGSSGVVKASRVYHVNLIIKFTSATHTRYERVRLVLTRRGIKRLEPVRGEILGIPG